MNRFDEIKHYVLKENVSASKRYFWLYKAFFRNVFLPHSHIPYLEVFVTTECNLNCDKCSNLIPHLSKQYHLSADEVIRNLESILQLTKYIYRLKLHGGEVFLHPELPKLINYVLSNKKLISIRLTTNGTIIPNELILNTLAGSRIIVQISDYEIASEKIPKLLEKFNEYNIKYVYLSNRNWRDMGDFSTRESNRFFECSIKRCTSMYKDEIFVCSRAAMALKENKISDSYHINISNISRTEFRNSIKKLSTIANEACRHCDGDTKFAKSIPAGKQVPK
jgi:organic radical activating enzyme